MKKLAFVFAFLFFVSSSYAQNCGKYFALNKGTVSEITNYQKNDKVAAVSTFTVQDVVNEGGAKVAKMLSVMKDDKGKELAQTEYDVSCKNNILSIDFNSMVTPQMRTQYKNMDMDVSGTNIELPDNMKVGDNLADADVLIKVNMSGINMKMTVEMNNRKVTGKENVTTPAGTFDCFVITYDVKMKMGFNMQSSSKQWIAAGVGLVKQEDYNKRGKVTSSSVLTAFKK